MAAMTNYHYEPVNTYEPFLMPIDEIFSIEGRGLLVSGMIVRGQVSIGDELELVGLNEVPSLVSVGGIEQPRFSDHALTAAYLRDNRMILMLRNIHAERIIAGMVLTQPGILKSSRRFKAHFNLFSADFGGRTEPFATGYRPQLILFDSHYDCEVSVLGNSTAGRRAANWELMIDTEDYLPVEVGTQFELRERHKIVGIGIISELWA